MHLFRVTLLVLGYIVGYVNSVSISGKPLAKRSHWVVPRTLYEPRPPLEKRGGELVERQSACDPGYGLCQPECCCPFSFLCHPTLCACCNAVGLCNGCTSPGYVECPAPYDFCCPTGQTCSIGAGNIAQCGGNSIGNNGNIASATVTSTLVVTPSSANNPPATNSNTGAVAPTPTTAAPSTVTVRNGVRRAAGADMGISALMIVLGGLVVL